MRFLNTFDRNFLKKSIVKIQKLYAPQRIESFRLHDNENYFEIITKLIYDDVTSTNVNRLLKIILLFLFTKSFRKISRKT